MTVIIQSSTEHLVRLIAHASLPSLVIMGLLLALSIVSWAIIISKYQMIRHALRESHEFLTAVADLSNTREALRASRRFPRSPLAALYLASHTELSRSEELPEGEAVARATVLERTLRKTALASVSQLEAGIPWLASIGTTAPFIGLFGTVVGIIMAFEGLSSSVQPSIETVAPAIAEALAATALGLFAAVPAYFAHNYFVARLRSLSALTEQFMLELLARAERSPMPYGLIRSSSS
ncbi:MAG TPA: MotA/TolQ/ExbB proton channel family protein [Blastocatellia bacterium]|nr:MotA/TolQ/ExbB proton channel family protein [Blastocatellia bacterium]